MSQWQSSAPVITIYKNGDYHFHGKKLVVNPKHYRSFDNFLDKVTQDTRAGVAIRKIHTPQHGTKIASLESIQNGAVYVAAGPERFKRMSYDKIGENLATKPNASPVKPVLHSKITACSRYKKEAMAEPLRNRIIFVYRNGEEKRPPMKLLLDKRTLKHMDAVLQYISNKINLTAGAVKSLYSLDTGAKVTDVSEINTNMLYVAVGTGKHFKGKYYSNDNADKLVSPKQKNNKLTKSKELKGIEENEIKPEVTGLILGDGLNNISENSDSLEVGNEDMLSYSSKEKSDPNFFEKVVEFTSDAVENNGNEINEAIYEVNSHVSAGSASVTSPVNNGNAESTNELSRTSPATSPTVNEQYELVTTETVQNMLSGTPPITSVLEDDTDNLSTGDDLSDASRPTSPITSNGHVSESIDNEISGIPAVNDAVNMSTDENITESSGNEQPDAPNINNAIGTSDEPITGSIDNELSDTPDVNNAISTSDELITKSIDTELSGTPDVNNVVNMSDEHITESVDNELSGTPDVKSSINEGVNNKELSDTTSVATTPTSNEVVSATMSEQSVYKASGRQQMLGDPIKDGKETTVEELIDAVPAEEVEEELQRQGME